MNRAGEIGVLHRNRKSSLGLSRLLHKVYLLSICLVPTLDRLYGLFVMLTLLSFAGSNDMTADARASTRNKDCGIAGEWKDVCIRLFFLQGERI